MTLIKGKLLPLNRGRYEHLQKINKIYRKDAFKYASACQGKLTVNIQEESLNLKKKGLTSRYHKEDEESQTDILLNRLRGLRLEGKKRASI